MANPSVWGLLAESRADPEIEKISQMEVVLDMVEEGERLKLVTMTMISNILSEDTTEVLAMA